MSTITRNVRIAINPAPITYSYPPNARFTDDGFVEWSDDEDAEDAISEFEIDYDGERAGRSEFGKNAIISYSGIDETEYRSEIDHNMDFAERKNLVDKLLEIRSNPLLDEDRDFVDVFMNLPAPFDGVEHFAKCYGLAGELDYFRHSDVLGESDFIMQYMYVRPNQIDYLMEYVKMIGLASLLRCYRHDDIESEFIDKFIHTNNKY